MKIFRLQYFRFAAPQIRAFIAICALLAVGSLAGGARAEDRYLDVRQGEFKPISIAVTRLRRRRRRRRAGDQHHHQ